MIVVAHRLQTIIESDKVLVLNYGEVAEYNTPSELRKNPDSHFTKLINEIQKDKKKQATVKEWTDLITWLQNVKNSISC